jgi:hypothetical protein
MSLSDRAQSIRRYISVYIMGKAESIKKNSAWKREMKSFLRIGAVREPPPKEMRPESRGGNS